MTDHTARLIVTILLFVIVLSSITSGYWFAALAWGLIMGAIALPFIRNGRFDPYYDEGPSGGPTFGGGSSCGAPEMFAGVPVVSR